VNNLFFPGEIKANTFQLAEGTVKKRPQKNRVEVNANELYSQMLSEATELEKLQKKSWKAPEEFLLLSGI
jgi:hypothetical protein